jgi:hypothetical protein
MPAETVTSEAPVSFTATDLMATAFPPVIYTVTDLVVPGLTLLAGAPKLGKSWLAMNLGVAIASGGKALGKLDTAAGDVLYLALEDPPRRLQERLRIVLEGEPAPARLHFATEWALMHDGGADELHAWVAGHPGTKAVVIDVLTKVRGTSDHREDRYQADYRAMSLIKQIADDHSIAVICVHHVRKAGAEDYVDLVSGTAGLAGASDTIAVLARSRGSADAKLHITGRDVREAELALTLTDGRWTLLEGPASDYEVSDQRRRILAAVRQEEGIGPKAIAEITGIKHDVVKHLVRKMLDDPEGLDTDGSGRYFPSVHRSLRSPVHSPSEESERGEWKTPPLRVLDDALFDEYQPEGAA